VSRGLLLVATRNRAKLREIEQILAGSLPVERLRTLADIDLPEEPDEETLEKHASFEENALAKARHFARRSGMPTLADDSGLCVDALAGEPGVRSRRFSGRTGLTGPDLDAANNAALLERLKDVPPPRRTARYACAVALVHPNADEFVTRAHCEGVILDSARGSAGFGYDPLFYVPSEGRTFGQLSPERKNQLSHRGAALRSAEDMIRKTLLLPSADDEARR
jgi:XTP/dITP diphosphohydrolase